MAKPVVAVVGRPNVGKSTLFNKLTGRRISIVEDTPGVTRDRICADCEWNGRSFTLMDTGGIEPRTDDVILSQMKAQAETAIDMADIIVLVVDITTGMTATDKDVAQMLLKSKKRVLLCVNKVDSTGEPPPELYEFYNLGLGDPYPVSSTHGLGTGDLFDAIVERLPEESEAEESEGLIKVAVIGKPNAGKSSLINRILGEERVIVSNIPGTTRDAIDQYYKNETGEYIFIDTAGIRKKSKVDEAIERYSVLRAYMAVDRADVCILMIDAAEGVTEQDTKIAGYAHEAGKACRLCARGGQGLHHRRQQVGHGGEDRPHSRRVHREGARRACVYDLCAGDLHLGAHRTAGAKALRADSLCPRAEQHPHLNRETQ